MMLCPKCGMVMGNAAVHTIAVHGGVNVPGWRCPNCGAMETDYVTLSKRFPGDYAEEMIRQDERQKMAQNLFCDPCPLEKDLQGSPMHPPILRRDKETFLLRENLQKAQALMGEALRSLSVSEKQECSVKTSDTGAD